LQQLGKERTKRQKKPPSQSRQGLKGWVREGLNPAIRPFASNNLGSQPSAGGPSGAPEGESQGIPKKLAVLARAGGRQIGRANANALAAKGNAGEDYCAGDVIGIGGNPDAAGPGGGLGAEPGGQGGDLGGGVVALEQFGQGLGRRSAAGAADQQTLRRP
jgi:hypothetical protein